MTLPVTPLITLEKVTLRHDGHLCFPETSWAIHRGESWGIFGENGAGKSILGAALSREVPVVKGAIRYFFDDGPPRSHLEPGDIVRISPEHHRALSRRHATYHQARWERIEEDLGPTLAQFLGESGVPPREEILERFGLIPLLSRHVMHLSNGEGRKALIARALMCAPKLLILDDPFGGLDPASRMRLREALGELQREQPLLLITSREDELLSGTTHLLVVREKRVTALGPRDQILLPGPSLSLREPAPKAALFPLQAEPSPHFETLARVEKTTVAYDGKPILQDITWEMKWGEHWAILGPNGAGKTTLLSLILADNPQGYTNPVTLFDRRRGTGESIWDIKRRIGWVSPELHLHYPRRFSCRDVVCSGLFDSLGLFRTPSPDQEALAEEWLSALGMPEAGERPFRTLSTGEQRLVLLARALVKQPTLLVLDEPCQGLDARHRAHILGLLDAIVRQHPVHLLFVTHHPRELPSAITHLLRLENGRLVQAGRWERPRQNPDKGDTVVGQTHKIVIHPT